MLGSMTDPTHQPTEAWDPVDRPGPPADAQRIAQPDPGPDTPEIVWIVRLARLIVLFIYVVVAACAAILGLGFVLRLFGASTDADFTEWVYRNVDRIMEPFRGMFPTEPLGDRSVVDFSLLFAMIVYGIVAVGLHALVSWLARYIVTLTRRQEPRRYPREYRTGPPGRPAR
jgi:uncharacterized protein YggT (Ycf19 family)